MNRLICVLIGAALLLSFCHANQPADNHQDGKQVRVLWVKNGDRRDAIEESSQLSLDLPLGESNKRSVSANDSSNSAPRQVSLASLMLNQRGPRSNSNQYSDPRLREKNESKLVEVISNKSIPWTELYLPRLKPSWLNVSQQFKITGNSIEEVDLIMPAEYLLRAAFDSPILLKTKLGILEGVRSIKFNKHLYTFLSVPYAKPPIAELRFKHPQPIEPWNGILQATKWPPFCVQPSMTLASKSSPVHVLSQMMSEDCLYLNIWTPSLKFNKNHKRPVMVWIHGGAFQYGGISVDENDASPLALMGDVVVVTLNYRVSAFGFLNANNDLNGPNNVGLHDQRAAMAWVYENIKQFGGDPNQITLFGESAGGHSVGLHMISPSSQQYFKRAILQSGVPVSFLRSYDVNNDNKGSATAQGAASVMMAKRLECYVPNAERASEQTDSNLTTTTTPSGLNSSEPLLVGLNETVSEVEEAEAELLEAEVDVAVLNDATLECMRNKSSLDILKAMGSPGSSGFFPTGDDLKGFFPNGNIMDSFDPDNLKVGPQKDYLIGTNTDEGTFMLHYGMSNMFPAKAEPKVDSIEALKAELTAEIERRSKLAEVPHNLTEIRSASGSQGGGAQAHLYRPLLKTSTSILEGFMPKSSVKVHENGTVTGNTTVYSKQAEFGKKVGSLITDIIFLCPARSLARSLSESGRNVYFYLYGYRSSLSQYHEWLGVTHHDEVEFVFGRPLRLADVYSGKDIEMSQRMIKTWSHFAYTGQMLDQLGVKWPKYGEEDNNYMTLISNEASVDQRYHDKVCNIYDTVIAVHLQDS